MTSRKADKELVAECREWPPLFGGLARRTAHSTERNVAQRLALCWALIGFVLTVVCGLCSSVGFDATLHAALLSLTVMYGVGWLSGVLWSQAFETADRRMKSAN